MMGQFRGLVGCLLIACLAVLALSWGSAAEAAKITRFQAGQRQAVLILGDIELADVDRFKALTADLRPGDVVALNSDGGKAFGALEIGKLIRDKSLATFVGSNATCVSACALIWVAGKPRIIVDGGKVGFHATYVSERGRSVETGVGNAVVGRYLTLLGLPEEAVVFATMAGPDEVSWLTRANSREAGIDFEAVEASQEPDSPATGRFFERTVGSWEVYGLEDSCWASRTFADGTELLFSLDRRPKLELFVAVYNPKWRAIEEGRDYLLVVETDQKLYLETASGHRHEDVDPGVAYFSKRPQELTADLQRSAAVEFRYSGKALGRYSLNGSAEAFRTLDHCLEQPQAR